MNILVTGRGGTSGSWMIRAEQMGRAIGATVQPNARDVSGFDATIVVKRTPGDLVARIHRAGVPLIYDVVDGWPQPEGNRWGRDQCMAWLRSKIKEVRPTGIVAATQAMAQDCEEFGVPVLALPHHARPGIERNPIRERVSKVGYEGAEHYLGRWRPILEAECARRSMTFHVNPSNLADLDVVVALRDVDGYAPRHWKSNVKMANAQASGTPIICGMEAGYLETASGAETFADTEVDLCRALNHLGSQALRQAISRDMLRAAPRLEDVAKTYRAWLTEHFACAMAGRS